MSLTRPRTELSNPGEHIHVLQPDGESLAAAHRESGDGAVLAAGRDTIVLSIIGMMSVNNSWLSSSMPSGELPPAQLPSVSPFDITISIGTALCCAIRLSRITPARPCCSSFLRYPRCHDAGRAPEICDSAHCRTRAACRRRACALFEWRGSVGTDLKRPVRHVLEFIKAGWIAWHFHYARVDRAAVLQVGIARIEDADSVNEKCVGVDFRLNRAEGDAPHAIRVFHRLRRNTTERQTYFGCFRRTQSEGDGAIRSDFGRYEPLLLRGRSRSIRVIRVFWAILGRGNRYGQCRAGQNALTAWSLRAALRRWP